MLPDVGSVATELYERFNPLAYADQAYGYPLLHLFQGLGLQLQDVEDVIRDTPDGPGWSSIVDVNRAPLNYLPWMGQMVGVIAPPQNAGESTEDYTQRLRDQIMIHGGFARGRPATIVAAAQTTLIGPKRVHLIERYQGSAYRMLLVTYDDDTPDPAVTEALVTGETVKPGGIKLIYEHHPGQSWNHLMSTQATWSDVLANYDTWADVINAD